MPKSKSLEDKIKEAEAIVLKPGEVSGTIITRVLGETEGSGVRWCIGLGTLNMPKMFGFGISIEAALKDVLKKHIVK